MKYFLIETKNIFVLFGVNEHSNCNYSFKSMVCSLQSIKYSFRGNLK